MGDAVVGLVISRYLYDRFPETPEGELTSMRAALVRAQTLGRIARDLGLGDLLYLSRGEEEAGGRVRRRLLAQTLEAVVGALYLDQGPSVAGDFLLRYMKPEVDRLERDHPITDAKTYLQELTQAEQGLRPVYDVLSTTGPGHRPHFVVAVKLGDRVLGTGEGSQKQEAEQAAARQALKNWPVAPRH